MESNGFQGRFWQIIGSHLLEMPPEGRNSTSRQPFEASTTSESSRGRVAGLTSPRRRLVGRPGHPRPHEPTEQP